MYGARKSNNCDITRRPKKQINQNYLYINTGYAYDEQVIQALTETFIRHDAKTRFKVSVVKKKGETCGYAYVWIESKNVFARLTGVDMDGNKKVKLIPDPTWYKPRIPVEEALAKFEQEDIYDPDSWGDCAEHESDLDDIRESYNPRMMEVSINADYKLPKYEYHEEQEKHINFAYIDDHPEHGAFVVGTAHIPKKKIEIQQHVIFCNRVPSWITMAQLKNLFSPYADDSHSLHKKKVNKRITTDTYPFIAINTPSSRNFRGRG